MKYKYENRFQDLDFYGTIWIDLSHDGKQERAFVSKVTKDMLLRRQGSIVQTTWRYVTKYHDIYCCKNLKRDNDNIPSGSVRRKEFIKGRVSFLYFSKR